MQQDKPSWKRVLIVPATSSQPAAQAGQSSLFQFLSPAEAKRGQSLLREDPAATPPGSRSRRKDGRARHWPRSWEVETKVGDTRLGSRTPGTSPRKDKSLYPPHSLPPRRGVPAHLHRTTHCWALFTRGSTLSSILWTNWVPRLVTPVSTGERQISAARSRMRHSLLSSPQAHPQGLQVIESCEGRFFSTPKAPVCFRCL